jgi:hypothetical protein
VPTSLLYQPHCSAIHPVNLPVLPLVLSPVLSLGLPPSEMSTRQAKRSEPGSQTQRGESAGSLTCPPRLASLAELAVTWKSPFHGSQTLISRNRTHSPYALSTAVSIEQTWLRLGSSDLSPSSVEFGSMYGWFRLNSTRLASSPFGGVTHKAHVKLNSTSTLCVTCLESSV